MYSQLQLCGASLEGRHLNSFFYFIGSNFSAKKMSVGYMYMCVCVRCLDFNLKKVYEIVEVPLLMRYCQVAAVYAKGRRRTEEKGALHTHIFRAFLQPPPLPLLLSACWINPQSCSPLHPASTFGIVCPDSTAGTLSRYMHFWRIRSFQFMCPDSVAHLFIPPLAHCLFICPFVIHSACVYCLLCLSSIQQGLCPFGEIETQMIGKRAPLVKDAKGCNQVRADTL